MAVHLHKPEPRGTCFSGTKPRYVGVACWLRGLATDRGILWKRGLFRKCPFLNIALLLNKVSEQNANLKRNFRFFPKFSLNFARYFSALLAGGKVSAKFSPDFSHQIFQISLKFNQKNTTHFCRHGSAKFSRHSRDFRALQECGKTRRIRPFLRDWFREVRDYRYPFCEKSTL